MDAIAVMMPMCNSRLKYFYVIEGDIKSYFDNVHHRKLISLLKRRIADRDITTLVVKFLKAGVMEDGLFTKTDTGVPQGGIISPLLANVYLHELDKWAEAKWNVSPYQQEINRTKGYGNFKLIRYADDFVILSNASIANVKTVQQELQEFLEKELHLELSAEKTKITHVNEGIKFLGFHIQGVKYANRWVIHLRPTKESLLRVKDKIKELTRGQDKILEEYVQLRRLNAIVAGWAEYYKYTSLYRDISGVASYTWHRYLLWLCEKHKGVGKRKLVRMKSRVIHNRIRWVAELQEGEKLYSTYQWMPTRKEFKRQRYPQRGKDGFSHPYLD